ncbi:MAG: hypothetical protein SFW35_12165 [Chitinophagales bacterium]|nr:hypothetical protein [Chitinophagales bacterium]
MKRTAFLIAIIIGCSVGVVSAQSSNTQPSGKPVTKTDATKTVSSDTKQTNSTPAKTSPTKQTVKTSNLSEVKKADKTAIKPEGTAAQKKTVGNAKPVITPTTLPVQKPVDQQEGSEQQ